MIRAFRIALVLSLALPLAMALPRTPVRAAPARVASACAGAKFATNAVVRFYLAIDARAFPQAYGCLAPGQQARWPFRSWMGGYRATTQTRLLWADSGVPNGMGIRHVAIELFSVNANGPRLFTGTWTIDSQGRLAGAAVHQLTSSSPTFNIARVMKQQQRAILIGRHADFTGDGVPETIYLTSGAGCGSCHAQQIFIYSGGRLVFEQQLDDGSFRAWSGHHGMEISTDTPNSPGLDSCCPTRKTIANWLWTGSGFVFKGQRVVKTGAP